MAKVLAVFGATGKQGGSVVSYALKNLGSVYKIRAITRNPNSLQAQNLKKQGAELAEADFNVKSTVEKALEGVHSVFSVSIFGAPGGLSEFEQGKLVAELAVKQGVKHFIWSTLPNVQKLTHGKFINVKHFDQKAEVEEYIKRLPIKSSFVTAGFYFQNFQEILKPVPFEGGFGVFNVTKPDTKFACIDIERDFGTFVGAILSSPEKFIGKNLLAANGLYSFNDLAGGLTEASGKTVSYVQIPDDTFKSFLPPVIADDLLEMFKSYDECGYPPNVEERVEESHGKVGFKSLSAGEYLKRLGIEL